MGCLETWVIKQHDLIEDMSQKFSSLDKDGIMIKDSNETESLRKKVLGMEIDVDDLKKSSRKDRENAKPFSPKLHEKKCTECEKAFTKNSDLEAHMIDNHGQEKTFKCKVCDKTFVLEWRMNKHLHMHGEKVSMCKFFTNNQHCPYEDIGCKFSHEPSENGNDDEDLDNDEGDGDESYEFIENQCHLCKLQMINRDYLYKHVETEHHDYH